MQGLLKQQRCLLILLLALCCASYVASTRICLNMIAKNEAEVLPEFLEPLDGELAGWTLCDTGSTDNTIQLMQEHFDKQSLPGIVARHDWKDFGYNRNLCMEVGLEWSLQEGQRQGMSPGSHFCDYLLFLDADQILHREPGIERGGLKALDLTGDAYLMVEKGIGLTYSTIRLASTRVAWEWVGEVHEYVQRVGETLTPKDPAIKGVWLHHDATGGPGGNRTQSDAATLSRAVKERPKDPRARFYLANTLRTLGRREEAIGHYVERIKLGGWQEEVFVSALYIAEQSYLTWHDGKLLSPHLRDAIGSWGTYVVRVDNVTEAREQEDLDAAELALSAALNATQDSDKDAAVQEATKAVNVLKNARKNRQFPLVIAAYMAAATILPHRPEPWVHLAKLHHIWYDDPDMCFDFAAAGLAQRKPRADALFVNTLHAEYELLDVMCACGYGKDVREEGRAACQKLERKLAADLLDSPGNTYLQHMHKTAKTNLGWYDKDAASVPEEPQLKECPAEAKGVCATRPS